ncbi:MAG: glycosyltransferase family 4 protein, partial [Desulfobacteraceae bacterium]|nr:glycosyltransferase family 4 protein [Desulfobacteraceae bacterium]
GGAARAAYRLHRGLREIGQDCRMLVRHKESQDDTVVLVDAEERPENPNEDFFLSAIIQPYYINSNQTELSNTLFSLSYPGFDLSELPVVQSADVVNLHWVAQYQSLVTLHRLFSLGKPVVWTLHDQWAFTGGCHYSAGCEKYQSDCVECPQLGDDPFNLPAAILKDKLEIFKNADLTIVTPSRWMASCARKSKLFKGLKIEVLPNSLETNIYTPLPKPEAKEKIGISPETITLLFGAVDGSEKRKGFFELVNAIKFCLNEDVFQKLLHDDKIRLVCFGKPSRELESIGIPFVTLGHLDSDEKIRRVYSAADIFLLPSLEDNLPNTILESMSCGTPVVAFDVGGLPDMVTNGVTGQLVPLSDTRKMGETIIDLIKKPDLRKSMGKEGRKRAEQEYSLSVQAGRYSDLYKELHLGNKSALQTAPAESAGETAWGHVRKEESLSVPVTTAIGPSFREIYDQVLMKALRSVPVALNLLDGRYDSQVKQIQELHVHLEARLVKIHALTGMLKVAEADRAAGKREIEGLKTILAQRAADINSLNAEHAKCLADIDRLTEDVYKLTEWLKDSQQRFSELRSRFPVRVMKKLKLI